MVGIGNPDRGDDGIGAYVVSRLKPQLPSDVTCLAQSGDMLSLIEHWAGFDAMVCVDAAAPMGGPGQIHRIDLAADDLLQEASFTSSHAFGLADAIALGRALGQIPEDIIVFAIEGCCFESGTALTPEVAAAAAAAADQIITEVVRLRRRFVEMGCHA